MARVGRIAGALLAETGGVYFIVGNTKTPCDWTAAGFEAPTVIDALKTPFLRLARLAAHAAVDLGPVVLMMDLDGEALARALAQRFVIERNGSVSERLWRLVVQRGDADADGEPDALVDADWLAAMPAPVWQIIRDTVLRCV